MTGEGEVRDFWDPYLVKAQGYNVPKDDIDRMLRLQNIGRGEKQGLYTDPKPQTPNPEP